MLKQKLINIFFILVLCIAGFTGKSFGLAFNNNHIGLRGMAMAGAFTGIADDSSAVYFNPAGLTAIENGIWDMDLGLLTIFSGFMYENEAGTSYESNKTASVPSLFAATSVDDLAFGVGIYIPYGGALVEWEDFPVQGRTFELKAGFAALTPAIAYRIIPNLSAGIGLSVYYGLFEEKLYEQSFGAEVKGKFDGIAGYGANVGIMFNATEELNIGFKYQTPVSTKMDGTLELSGALPLSGDAELELTLPSMYILGLAYQVTPGLTIDLDFWYERWSEMDEAVVTSEALALVGGEMPIKTYYDDSYEVMIGGEYRAGVEFRLNGSLRYEKQVAKDKGVKVTNNCETDRYTVTFGGGYSITDNVELGGNLGYAIGIENKRDDGSEYDGTYSQEHISMVVGMRAKI